MPPEVLLAIINQLLPIMENVTIEFIECMPEVQRIVPERISDNYKPNTATPLCG